MSVRILRTGCSALRRAHEAVPRAIATVVHDGRAARDAVEPHGDIVFPHREVDVGCGCIRFASKAEQRSLQQIVSRRNEEIGITLEVRHDRLPAVAMIHDHAPTVAVHPAGEGHNSARRRENVASGGGASVIADEIHGVVPCRRVVGVLVLVAPIPTGVSPDLAVPVVVHDTGERELEVAD